VGGGESICVPGEIGDQAESATDGEAGLRSSGERRIGVKEIPARGWPGLDQIKLGSKGRR
jgi:hypothetical protein